jgi:hypothetical protein
MVSRQLPEPGAAARDPGHLLGPSDRLCHVRAPQFLSQPPTNAAHPDRRPAPRDLPHPSGGPGQVLGPSDRLCHVRASEFLSKPPTTGARPASSSRNARPIAGPWTGSGPLGQVVACPRGPSCCPRTRTGGLLLATSRTPPGGRDRFSAPRTGCAMSERPSSCPSPRPQARARLAPRGMPAPSRDRGQDLGPSDRLWLIRGAQLLFRVPSNGGRSGGYSWTPASFGGWGQVVGSWAGVSCP